MRRRFLFKPWTALAMAPLALAAQAQPAAGWTGTWKGSEGALIAVQEGNGTLEVWGKDEASIYRLACVVDRKDPSQARCVGDGMNHARGTRFTYRSTLKLEAGALVEQWEAQEHQGTASGSERFARVATVK